MINKFIVLEGVCCSGKSTLSLLLKEKLDSVTKRVVCNHGALTFSRLGEKYNEIIKEIDFPASTIYYLIDLILNTKNFILPKLETDCYVIQDRYYNSITSYIEALGEYSGKNYNIYEVIKDLKKETLLLEPSIEVFCIPEFDVLQQRMTSSKKTQIHNYYRENPEFFELMYNKIKKIAEKTEDSIIIDTNKKESIDNGLKLITERI